jgi:hypothetical protein
MSRDGPVYEIVKNVMRADISVYETVKPNEQR